MKKILLILLGILLVMQFFRIDKTNPQVNVADDLFAKNPASSEVEGLIKAACYDCHSYEVKYPWYTDVAPVSFWIKRHINHAQKSLNFSVWETYDRKKQSELAEESAVKTEKGFMPLKSYTWMHSEAKLTEKQKSELAAYFRALK